MEDIKKLLLTKEHFMKRGEEIKIPPYHPTMEEGLDLDLACELAPLVFRGTLEDFGLDPEDNKSEFHVERGRDSFERGYVRIYGLPRICLQITSDIVENGYTTQSIMLRSNIPKIFGGGESNFLTYKPFSEPLMREYDAKLVREFPSGKFWMRSPHVWYTHNLTSNFCVALLNFGVLYDNAVVKRKYSQ